MHISQPHQQVLFYFFIFLGEPKPFHLFPLCTHLILLNHSSFVILSFLFLSSSFLIWSLPTSEPLPEVQTSEWRHQVVPTVVRPHVRRPIAPSPVDAPTSPFILPSPSSMIPDPHIYTQTSTVAPVIASISVPSSDSLTGTYVGLNLYLFHSHSVCVHIVCHCVLYIDQQI